MAERGRTKHVPRLSDPVIENGWYPGPAGPQVRGASVSSLHHVWVPLGETHVGFTPTQAFESVRPSQAPIHIPVL